MKVVLRKNSLLIAGILAISQLASAADKVITGVRPSSKEKLELLEKPQADSAVSSTVPISSITFPLKVEEESGRFYLVRVGGVQGWVRASGVSEGRDAKVVCAELAQGGGARPGITVSTPGIGKGCSQ